MGDPAIDIDPRVAAALNLQGAMTRNDLAVRVAELAGFSEPRSSDAVAHIVDLAIATADVMTDLRGTQVDIEAEVPNAVLGQLWLKTPEEAARATSTFVSLEWPTHPEAAPATKQWELIAALAVELDRSGHF